MNWFSRKFSSCPGTARTMSAALGLFLLSSLPVSTGCGAFGLTYSLTGLTVSPNAACIAQGSTAQFTAYGTYTEGGHASKTQDITDQVNWTSDLTEVATINSSGLATSGIAYIGLANIEASTQGEFGLLHATSNLTVENDCTATNARVGSLDIVPAVSTIRGIGDTESALAIAVSPTEPRATDVTAHVTWASDNPAVATVDAAGRIAGVGPGRATITATRKLPDGATVSATQIVDIAGGAQNP